MYLIVCVLYTGYLQFSPLTSWVVEVGGGGHQEDDLAETLFQSYSAGGHCDQLWHRQGRPLFDVVHPALFLCRPRRRPDSKLP